MGLATLVKTLEERQKAYRKIWVQLKRSDRIMIIALVIVGIINVIVGSAMLWL